MSIEILMNIVKLKYKQQNKTKIKLYPTKNLKIKKQIYHGKQIE